MNAAPSREPRLDAAHVTSVANLQILMSDALAAGQQAVGELLRIEMHVPLDVLEPLHPIPGGTLQLERLDLALFLILSQRGRDVSGSLRQHSSQCHRVFHRQLGTGPDAEVRRMLCVADQDDVLVIPALAQNALELEPGSRTPKVSGIRDERIAIETV